MDTCQNSSFIFSIKVDYQWILRFINVYYYYYYYCYYYYYYDYDYDYDYHDYYYYYYYYYCKEITQILASYCDQAITAVTTHS